MWIKLPTAAPPTPNPSAHNTNKIITIVQSIFLSPFLLYLVDFFEGRFAGAAFVSLLLVLFFTLELPAFLAVEPEVAFDEEFICLSNSPFAAVATPVTAPSAMVETTSLTAFPVDLRKPVLGFAFAFGFAVLAGNFFAAAGFLGAGAAFFAVDVLFLVGIMFLLVDLL